MKSVINLNGLVTRLATVAAVLLFSQQAFAVGTAAGTDVNNQASIAYSVGSVPQTAVQSNIATFRVDNRVNFTLVPDPNPVVPTQVNVGDTQVAVRFLLQNTGNQTQDFAFLPTNEADGVIVNGNTDSGQMNNLSVVADNNDDNTVNDAEDFIEELTADATRVVWIVADADTPIPNELLDGDFAHVLLSATVRAGGGGGLGGIITTSASDTVGTEDVVVAVGGVLDEDSASAQNTYQVASASLTVTKASLLIDDPINGTVNPFHIPGATVEYTITVTNNSLTVDADAISISDELTNVTLVADPFALGYDVEIINNGAAAILDCDADGGDGDTDGCALDLDTPAVGTNTLTVGNANLVITVVANTTLTIRFQVTID